MRLWEKTQTCHWRDSGSLTPGSGSAARNDIEQQHGRVRSIQMIDNAHESELPSRVKDGVSSLEQRKLASEAPRGRGSFEISPRNCVLAPNNLQHQTPWRNKGKRQLSVSDECHVALKSKGKGKKRKGGRRAPFLGNVSWRNQGQRNPVQNGYTAPYNSATNGISSEADDEFGEYVNYVSDSQEISTSLELNADAMVRRQSETESEDRLKKFMNELRAYELVCSSFNGNSTSPFQNLEASGIESPGLIPQSSRNGDSPELDELLDPRARFNSRLEHSTAVSDQFSARIGQIEQDEILARQLQDQFNAEVAESSGSEEIDAIEWSPKEEDAQFTACTARTGLVNHEREMTSSDLHGSYAQSPYQRSSVDHAGNQQSRVRSYHDSEIELERILLAEARRFQSMDAATRHNFLEVLEDVFGRTYATHRNFNENDYETLAVDHQNNIQQTGASESQISSLPQCVIQNVIEEACAICLANPSRGDTIRHLPCLHRFHKECIDTWLRRTARCPVCKSAVS